MSNVTRLLCCVMLPSLWAFGCSDEPGTVPAGATDSGISPDASGDGADGGTSPDEAGDGTSSCEDDCADGDRDCQADGRRTCGQFDSDECLDWSEPSPCEAGQLCEDGLCRSPTTCPDPCEAINLHTTFSDDSKTSVWVSWRGDTTDEVEYGTSTSYGSLRSGASFPSEGGIQHHVELTGLTPGTKHFYRVGGSDQTGSFETAPAGAADFSFVIPGDIQGGAGLNNRWVEAHNWVLANHAEPISFWISLGDQVSHGLQQSEWDWFFTSSDTAARDFAFLPLIGNHETYVDLGHDELVPQPYLDQFRLPDNGHSTYQNYWYSFEYGDALFIVMSWLVNPDTAPGMREEMRQEQTSWLQTILPSSTHKWKFALLHAPIYTTYRNVRSGDSHPEWNQLWETHNVNAVINGDTHFYEYSVPIYEDAEVADYSVGTLYYGTAGIRNSPTGGTDWWTADTQDVADEPLIGVVDVGDTTATITTYNYEDGSTKSTIVLPVRSGSP